MPPNTRLAEVAQTILDTLVDDLTLAGIAVPERRYTHTGEIAHDFAGADCTEQLAVSWNGNFHGVAGGDFTSQPLKCAVPQAATFVIALLRCVPVVNSRGIAPGDSALSASAEDIMIDAMTLGDVIINASLDSSLTGIGCSLNALVDFAPYGPTGGVGGTVISIVVGLI